MIKFCSHLTCTNITQNFPKSCLDFFKMYHEISLNSSKIITQFTLHFHKYNTKFTQIVCNFQVIIKKSHFSWLIWLKIDENWKKNSTNFQIRQNLEHTRHISATRKILNKHKNFRLRNFEGSQNLYRAQNFGYSRNFSHALNFSGTRNSSRT